MLLRGSDAPRANRKSNWKSIVWYAQSISFEVFEIGKGHSQSLMIGEGPLPLYWIYCDAILALGFFRVIESNSEKNLGLDYLSALGSSVPLGYFVGGKAFDLKN